MAAASAWLPVIPLAHTSHAGQQRVQAAVCALGDVDKDLYGSTPTSTQSLVADLKCMLHFQDLMRIHILTGLVDS